MGNVLDSNADIDVDQGFNYILDRLEDKATEYQLFVITGLYAGAVIDQKGTKRGVVDKKIYVNLCAQENVRRERHKECKGWDKYHEQFEKIGGYDFKIDTTSAEGVPLFNKIQRTHAVAPIVEESQNSLVHGASLRTYSWEEKRAKVFVLYFKNLFLRFLKRSWSARKELGFFVCLWSFAFLAGTGLRYLCIYCLNHPPNRFIVSGITIALLLLEILVFYCFSVR